MIGRGHLLDKDGNPKGHLVIAPIISVGKEVAGDFIGVPDEENIIRCYEDSTRENPELGYLKKLFDVRQNRGYVLIKEVTTYFGSISFGFNCPCIYESHSVFNYGARNIIKATRVDPKPPFTP